MHFLDLWLPFVGWTISGIVYEKIRQKTLLAVDLVPLLGLEILVFASWATYWILLYPAYFTPFKNLPTPPVSPCPYRDSWATLPGSASYANGIALVRNAGSSGATETISSPPMRGSA